MKFAQKWTSKNSESKYLTEWRLYYHPHPLDILKRERKFIIEEKIPLVLYPKKEGENTFYWEAIYIINTIIIMEW